MRIRRLPRTAGHRHRCHFPGQHRHRTAARPHVHPLQPGWFVPTARRQIFFQRLDRSDNPEDIQLQPGSGFRRVPGRIQGRPGGWQKRDQFKRPHVSPLLQRYYRFSPGADPGTVLPQAGIQVDLCRGPVRPLCRGSGSRGRRGPLGARRQIRLPAAPGLHRPGGELSDDAHLFNGPHGGPRPDGHGGPRWTCGPPTSWWP